MSHVPYTLDADDPAAPPLGLIVLSADETIEPEFRRYFADHPSPVYVSRIPSGLEVTPTTLAAMEAALPAAADLLPKGLRYRAVGYACTSASSVIGSDRVADMIRQTCATDAVTDPIRATAAEARSLGISRLALLSPYVEEVNEPLRTAFGEIGLEMDHFASFGEAEESRVVRISKGSIVDAAISLGRDPSVEGVFLSCTNLRTIDAIPVIEAAIGKPVLSSNRSLAWHLKEQTK
ncbi:MAG: Asp/Glu racemase [Paracoccaceae bacterium]|nr:Asp/Glu racemase [Paracoccaceae bacterium]